LLVVAEPPTSSHVLAKKGEGWVQLVTRLIIAPMGHTCSKAKMTDKTHFSQLEALDIEGNPRRFDEWNNKAVMVINVASA